MIPEHGPIHTVVTGVAWDCPPEGIDEAVAVIAGAFRAAPEDGLAAALYRLRTLTRSREERSPADQEAEATIWIEQLRAWPGDIALEVLRAWPSGQNGQYWPTWHEIQAQVRRLCERRLALLNLARRLAEGGSTAPGLVFQAASEPPEARARAVERWEREIRPGLARAGSGRAQETPADVLARACGLTPEEAQARLDAIGPAGINDRGRAQARERRATMGAGHVEHTGGAGGAPGGGGDV